MADLDAMRAMWQERQDEQEGWEEEEDLSRETWEELWAAEEEHIDDG